jgi:sugar phosphate permease
MTRARGTTKVHRAWWIAAVAGLVIVVTGASTGIPDLLTDPLREEFGWSRGTIGAAFAVNMALYGLTAPFAAALMDRFGMRRVVTAALATIAAGAALTTVTTTPAELVTGWGLLVGLGTGSLALTFGATVTHRWFVARRGMVSGALTSASMFGGMVLLPALAWVVRHAGWRPSVVTVGLAAFALVPVVWVLLRDHPADLGVSAYGAAGFSPKPAPVPGATRRALAVFRDAAATGPFWLLVGTYGVCGASTNGIMMTHFVPAAHERGMPITVAATLLAVMGVCNVVGATGSGWLTDRFDARWLLGAYYGVRGVSLVCLPLLMDSTVRPPMLLFVVGYGLLDLATVPPTITLCQEFYGRASGPVVFGWVSAAHAVGAGAAAFLGGVARGALGSYTAVWLGAAALCGVAVLMSLAIRQPSPRPVPADPTGADPANADPTGADPAVAGPCRV